MILSVKRVDVAMVRTPSMMAAACFVVAGYRAWSDGIGGLSGGIERGIVTNGF